MSIQYNQIGDNYNFTRRADPFLASRLIYHLRIKSDQRYLDIGCGTENYTRALAQSGINMVGVDPSIKMLKAARSLNADIEWKIGSAEEIPFDDRSFSGSVASLTLHHWGSLSKGFSELHRVMDSKGRLVIFTSMPQQMQGYWLNYYFPEMLKDSMKQMPAYDEIEKSLKEAGLQIESTEKYFVKDDLQDLFLYAGKNRPQLYLDEQIRTGISSFSSLANKDEVAEGLATLENDIEAGDIDAIIHEYDNEQGDYLFIIASNVN